MVIFDVAGVEDSPASKIKRTAIDNNNSKVYINNASDELQQLKQHPLIKEFASVRPEIYDLVSVSNPTLKMMMDFAKMVMECGE